MQTRFVALALVALVPVIACGSSTESDDDASVGADAGSLDASDDDATLSSTDGSLADGASDAGDSAACVPQTCSNSLVQQGAVVASTYEAATAPTLNGGTIRDGVYVLTKQTYYERETNGPAETTVQTIQWGCGVTNTVGAVNSYPPSRSFTVVTSSSPTTLTETVTNCNYDDSGADANVSFVIADAPFEANLTTLKFYIPVTKVMLTYTKL